MAYILVEEPTQRRPPPKPSQGSNGFAKLLVVIMAGTLLYQLYASGALNTSSSAGTDSGLGLASRAESPAPGLGPVISSLPATQTALGILEQEANLTGTALIHLSIAAGLTQEAAVFETEQYWRDFHRTETESASKTAAAAKQASETAAAATAIPPSLTAEILQRTKVAATEETWISNNNAEKNRRAAVELFAAAEPVFWRCLVPFVVIGALVLALSCVAIYYARKSAQPQPVEVGALEEEDDDSPLPVIRLPIVRGNHQELPGLPVPFQKLVEFADGIVNKKKPLTHKQWVGRLRGRLFSRGEFDRLMAWMVDRGWARYKDLSNHKGGADLTADGYLALRQIAPPPPPEQ